jgi:sterol desaturase/sphingolipid hydroxylase (fatty acid hydroxylase superfamily)
MIRDRLGLLLRWTAYPVLFAGMLGTGLLAIQRQWNLQRTYGIAVAGLVVSLMVLEALHPLRLQWRMKWRTFLRDLKYITAGSLTIGLVNSLFGLLTLKLAGIHRGPLSDAPLYVAVPAGLLTFEALNYAYHRASHELGGRLGRLLWLSHAAHHLPEQIYVLMHAAFHPINAFITRGFTMVLPLFLLGLSPEAVILFSLVDNFCGIISHCNLDVRGGWLNYVLVGPELHRYHHSADPAEAKNYGAALPIFDLLFGTFVYKPGVFPVRIGVKQPAAYPRAEQFWEVMRLPFAKPKATYS